MLKNYLKIAFRSLLKQRIYSLINILGLSVGMASVVLILLHVEDELSYDKFNVKGDRIYKLQLERLYPDHVTKYAATPHSFPEMMVNDFPEVENAVRLVPNLNAGVVVRYTRENGEEVNFEEDRFMLTDSTFFDVFSLELINGDKEKILTQPQEIVITEEMAYKYFGDEDPINKVLKFEFGGPQPFEATVTGVCENVPENSHFEFDFIGSILINQFFQQPNFYAFSSHSYLLLNENADVEALEAKFPEMVLKYAAPQLEQNLNTSYEEYVAAGNGYDYRLVNLYDIHLNPVKYEGEIKQGGNKTYVNLFIVVAFLILVIACINFMNLSTARSAERAREVGMRKTLGSLKRQLIYQFLTESVLISFISLAIAFLLIQLTIPQFNNLAQKSLALSLTDSMVVPGLIGFSLIVGLLAGSYPALVMSSFRPAEILKGNMQTKKEGSWLRNGLVVFQFAISIILISGTILVQKQIAFIQNKDLGFDKDHVMVIYNAVSLGEQFESFQAELRAMPEVVSVGGTNALPGGGILGMQFIPEGSSEVITVNGVGVDDDYIETLNFEIIEGRDFSPDFNDSATVIINEQTKILLGIDNPVGTKMTLQGLPAQNNVQVTIIGVIKDFHYLSLHNSISPFVFISSEPNPVNVLIPARIESDNLESAISSIESKWNMLVPDQAFEYTFLDDDLYELYQNEVRSATLLNVFSILAIIIACVGLFGLAAYTAGLRTKEIGVRKVLGASVGNVVLMLSRDFTKLVLIAFVLGTPVSWFAADQWLDNFAYQTTISPWIFIVAGSVALLIAWGTVSYQSIKAAIVNPVKSLRSE